MNAHRHADPPHPADRSIAQAAAARALTDPDTPEAEVIAAMYAADDYDQRARIAACRHPSLRVNTLRNLLNSAKDNPPQRIGIAANPNASSDMLEHLAGDDDIRVQISVASNPNTTEDALRRLYDTSQTGVIIAIAANPSLTGALRSDLVEDLLDVASGAETSGDDSTGWIRAAQALAAGGALPAATRSDFINAHPQAARAMLADPDAPAEKVIAVADKVAVDIGRMSSPLSLWGEMLVTHPKCPPEAAGRLASRAAAEARRAAEVTAAAALRGDLGLADIETILTSITAAQETLNQASDHFAAVLTLAADTAGVDL